MAIVYLVTNLVNGKRYVGKTKWNLARRWKEHLKSAKKGSSYAIHAAIRKYGSESFGNGVLGEYVTEEEALRSEVFWIDKFKTFGPAGYNMTAGGRGIIGFQHSIESKEKMSEIAKTVGRKPPESAVINSVAARLGVPLTEEQRANMSVAQQKRRAENPATEEFLENCSKAQIKKFEDGYILPPLSESHKAALLEGRRKVGWHPPPATDEFRAKMSVIVRSQTNRLTSLEKKCQDCGVDQTPENTGKSSSRASGLQRRCRICEKLYMDEWKRKNKEKRAE